MFETELLFGGLLCLWILYELYGRKALEWMAFYTTIIRIGGGILVLGFLYWQATNSPEQFTDTLQLAKDTLLYSRSSSSSSSSLSKLISGGDGKEKRNVTGLMKKRVAASQEWKCGHCKTLLDETYEVDHILALFNGGSNDMSNLVALCPACHRKKTVDERIASVAG